MREIGPQLDAIIREAVAADGPEWLKMRLALWPDDSASGHEREMAEILTATGDYAAFVAARPEGKLVGFVEVSIRRYAEGAETSPVGYIEGWYVDEDVRRRGIGGALVEAAESWARGQGLKELGSDTEMHNQVSQAAHRALGYHQLEPIVPFVKRLDGSRSE